MPITLSALDPKQVASATNFEVHLGEPATRLLILSGIAVPEFWTNHDEETNEQDIFVRLGVHVAQLDKAVTNVGLASIENDETNFLFAVDSGVLELEQPSGELVLKVRAAILRLPTGEFRYFTKIADGEQVESTAGHDVGSRLVSCRVVFSVKLAVPANSSARVTRIGRWSSGATRRATSRRAMPGCTR